MDTLRRLIFIVLMAHVIFAKETVPQESLICPEKERLRRVILQEECSKEIYVNNSVEVVPSNRFFSILQNCLNCSLTIRTGVNMRLTATLTNLATETGQDGECDLNRLDIYNGDHVTESSRLTNASGICGCDLQAYAGFKSTNNTLTLAFDTQCGVPTQHGEFELVVTAVKKEFFDERRCQCDGFFECEDGMCLDKNLVCDGQFHCKDHSDENGCNARNGTCNNQFICTNGQCINKNFICDGLYNCVDHSDEENCTRMRNGSCPGLFECQGNRKCINKELLCDGKNNCGDWSDENGCSFYHRYPRLLMYVLIAIGCLILVVFIVVLGILCWRYCSKSGKIASAYRRLA